MEFYTALFIWATLSMYVGIFSAMVAEKSGVMFAIVIFVSGVISITLTPYAQIVFDIK